MSNNEQGKVVGFKTGQEYDTPDALFEKVKGDYQDALIVGYDQRGQFIYDNSFMTRERVLYLLELMKKKILDVKI